MPAVPSPPPGGGVHDAGETLTMRFVSSVACNTASIEVVVLDRVPVGGCGALAPLHRAHGAGSTWNGSKVGVRSDQSRRVTSLPGSEGTMACANQRSERPVLDRTSSGAGSTWCTWRVVAGRTTQ